MNKNRLERLDKLFNQVYKISEILNDISMEIAKLIREISKEEIESKNSTQ